MRILESRPAVFLVALAVRFVVAFVTFGTSDLGNSFRNTSLLLHGEPVPVPYLPGVDLLLFDAGMLARFTPVPVAFAYKVIPLVCDALLALVIAGAASRRAGLLYALNPVPVMIAGMHVQWDPIVLLFLATAMVLSESSRGGRAAAAGAFWFLSAIVKPFTLVFLPFLLRRRTPASILPLGVGAALAAAGYLVLLVATGHAPDPARISDVIRYAGSGLRVFGFPIQFEGLAARLPVIAALTGVLIYGFRRRTPRRDVLLAAFAVTLGLSSLAAQYLCWLLPFALLSRRYRIAAVYSLVAGVFLVYYYRAPVVEISNLVALGAYGMLAPLRAWTPPAYLNESLLRFAGNLVIPALCLAIGVIVFRRPLAGLREETGREEANGGAAVAALVLIAFLSAWAWLQPPVAAGEFTSVMLERIETRYDVVRYRGPLVDESAMTWLPRTMVEDRARPLANLATVLLVWVLAVSLITWPGEAGGMEARRGG